MKIIKALCATSILFFFALISACTSTTDPAEMYKGESGNQIFQKGEEALRDKSYSESVKRFEALDAQYPYDVHAETANLHVIYSYYMTSEYASAESAADRFLRSYPVSPHVDYAYYMRGLSNYYQNLGVFERLFQVDLATRDLSQIKKSYNDFSMIVKRYPNSYYAPAAYQYMIYLRNILADHQLDVANYYFEKRAYVAAANRASLLVRHYEGAPTVPDALVIMAKSYRELHLTQLEQDTIRVIQYNYPGTKI